MVNVVIGVDGARGFGHQIDKWVLNLRQTGGAFNKIADFQVREWRKQFDSQGSHLTGAKWAPLSPGYRTWKAAHFPGQPILVASGRLRRSLTSRPLGIEEYSLNQIKLGTDVPYAAYHQRGTRHMPARKIYGTSDDKRRNRLMADIMTRWITKGEL